MRILSLLLLSGLTAVGGTIVVPNLPPPNGIATTFLNGTMQWSTPAGGGGGTNTSNWVNDGTTNATLAGVASAGGLADTNSTSLGGSFLYLSDLADPLNIVPNFFDGHFGAVAYATNKNDGVFLFVPAFNPSAAPVAGGASGFIVNTQLAGTTNYSSIFGQEFFTDHVGDANLGPVVGLSAVTYIFDGSGTTNTVTGDAVAGSILLGAYSPGTISGNAVALRLQSDTSTANVTGNRYNLWCADSTPNRMDGPLTIAGTASAGTVVATKAFQSYQGTLTHAGTVTLDFDAATTINFIQLTGAVTFAFSNINTNRTYGLLIQGCSTNSAITWPVGVHGDPYSVSTANKWMRATLEAWRGATATNVFITTVEDP